MGNKPGADGRPIGQSGGQRSGKGRREPGAGAGADARTDASGAPGGPGAGAGAGSAASGGPGMASIKQVPPGPPESTLTAFMQQPTEKPPAAATGPELADLIGSLGSPLRQLPVSRDDEVAVDDQHFATTKSTGLTSEDFELLKVIGKGSFGKVMQVKKKDTGKIYAMKVLKKAQLVKRKQVAHTKTERKVLEDINNPFIVSLRFAYQTDTKLYMVLDYFTGGELFFHLKNGGKFSEERAKFYAAEIAIAMQCLHDHDIVYRDLKPENVLLDEDGHVRLTDFGLSKENVSTVKMTHTFCGTPEYLAPEVIHGQGYGIQVDWWSLGTLLYEMLTGLPPFYNQNLHVMYEKIIRGKLHFPAHLSAEARGVLTALLERNPKARLCTRGGIEELRRHPFFATLDFEKLYRKEIKPPFRPDTTEGKLDTTNIDDEFKKETPKDTPVMASTLRSKVVFPGFTYRGPESHLDNQSSELKGAADSDSDDDGSMAGAAPKRVPRVVTKSDLEEGSPIETGGILRQAIAGGAGGSGSGDKARGGLM